MKNTKRVEAGDISPSFPCQVGKKIAELEKRKIKYLLNFWVGVQKLTEIQHKINILRNTKKKIKKNKYKEKDAEKRQKERDKTRREINNKKWMLRV